MRHLLNFVLAFALLTPSALAQTGGAAQLAGGTLAQRPTQCRVSARQVYFQTDSAGEGPGTYECGPSDNQWRRIGVTAHNALTGLSADDHPQYQLRSEKNQANGYAGLDSSGLMPDNRLPASVARDSEVSAAVSAHEAGTGVHPIAGVTGLQSALDAKLTQAAADLRYSLLGHAHAAGDVTSGTFNPDRLGTGTRDGTKFLRDDGTWQTAGGGVTSFNTRTGAVSLLSADVTGALGYTPRDAAAATVNTFNTRTGAVTLNSGDVTGALGYAPLNPAGNLSDLANAGTARTNLGLGSAALEAESAFARLLGRAGGQTLSGGTASGENLTLQSTAHATKGRIFFGASSAYDGASERLGIGTTSPGAPLTVVGNLFNPHSAGKRWSTSPQATHWRFGSDAAEIMSLSDTGVKISASPGVPSAQLHVQAGAPSTKGLIVQMAASPTANPFEVQDSTGAAKFAVSTGGNVDGAAYLINGLAWVFTTGFSGRASGASFRAPANGLFAFAATNDGAGTLDTSASRASAGVWQFGDGSSNANGTIMASRFRFSATLTPSGSADAQGSTGDLRYDANFLYVKTAAGWVRAALSTF